MAALVLIHIVRVTARARRQAVNHAQHTLSNGFRPNLLSLRSLDRQARLNMSCSDFITDAQTAPKVDTDTTAQICTAIAVA